MTATLARKPKTYKKKPARSYKVLRRATADRPGWLRITVGKERTVYQYAMRPEGDGVAYRLRKYLAPGVYGEVYDVLLSETAGNQCDCKGFTSHRHCKHTDTCLALTERDKHAPIPVAAPAPRAVCKRCEGIRLVRYETGRGPIECRCPCCAGTGEDF